MGFSASKSKQKSASDSQSTSASLNQSYPFIQEAYAPAVAQGNNASNAIANLLGLNGATGQDEGFQKFKDSSGYSFVQDEGVKGITSSNAAKGLLNSGSTLKGITKFSSGLAKNFLDSYLANLTGLSNTGLGAGQIISGAGNTANSQSTSNSTGSGSSIGVGLKFK